MAISKDNNLNTRSHATHIFLRFLAVATTITAACLMLTNKQITVVYEITVDARYTYSPAFKFYAAANIVACAFSIVSLILVWFMGRKAMNSTHYFCFFLHDLIMTVLLMGGLAATMAIAYVGKYGNSHTGWLPICDHFGKFCKKGVVSGVFGFLGVFIYLLLTIISANESRRVRA